ncbi:hypothetical protein FHR88_002401 [Bradyrhizobium betae]|nr:hypothetical protein [Bradyrhizobium betae]
MTSRRCHSKAGWRCSTSSVVTTASSWALFHHDYDGWPPPSLLLGTGYPGAHMLVWRMVQVGEDRVWRLVKAVGWRKED